MQHCKNNKLSRPGLCGDVQNGRTTILSNTWKLGTLQFIQCEKGVLKTLSRHIEAPTRLHILTNHSISGTLWHLYLSHLISGDYYSKPSRPRPLLIKEPLHALAEKPRLVPFVSFHCVFMNRGRKSAVARITIFNHYRSLERSLTTILLCIRMYTIWYSESPFLSMGIDFKVKLKYHFLQNDQLKVPADDRSKIHTGAELPTAVFCITATAFKSHSGYQFNPNWYQLLPGSL